MSENISESHEQHRLVSEELAALGELVVAASERSDLGAVAAEHDLIEANPNSTKGNFLFKGGDIATENDFVYRQVGIDAVHDLAASGVVRNRQTAIADHESRWGSRVFWHKGESGKALNVGSQDGSSAVIVAHKADADAGWITADKVQSVYSKTPDGKVVDLLAKK